MHMRSPSKCVDAKQRGTPRWLAPEPQPVCHLQRTLRYKQITPVLQVKHARHLLIRSKPPVRACRVLKGYGSEDFRDAEEAQAWRDSCVVERDTEFAKGDVIKIGFGKT